MFAVVEHHAEDQDDADHGDDIAWDVVEGVPEGLNRHGDCGDCVGDNCWKVEFDLFVN